jgi:hypothetical protein
MDGMLEIGFFFFLIFYPKTLELYSINITSALIKSIRNKS